MSAKRLEWIDLLRAVAIVGVVVIHAQGAFAESEHGSENWWIFNVLNSVAHFSVPVFIMISGALLLKSNEPLGLFLKRRLFRVLVPFLFWSVILFLGNIVLGRPMSRGAVVSSYLNDLAGDKINFTHWFVHVLIGIYLAAPILKRWIEAAKKEEVEYFIAIWCLTLFLGAIPDFRLAVDLRYFSGFIGYFVLGYYIDSVQSDMRRRGLVAFIFIIVGSGFTILGNALYAERQFESCLMPNIMILTAGVFLLAKGLCVPKRFGIDGMVNVLSRCSYGVYLVHIVFISILNRNGVNCLSISPYLGTWVVVAIVLSVSVAIVETLRRIPILRYVSGAH